MNGKRIGHLIAATALLLLLCPLSARAGGAPPSPTQTPKGAWKTIITVGSTGGLAIDRRSSSGHAAWAYVPNPANRTLIKFSIAGARLASWKYGPRIQYQTPVGVAVGGAGNVFVADGGTNRVVKFDSFGRQLEVFSDLSMPSGVAVDRTGNIYVAEWTALRITKLSPSGAVLAHWHVPWIDDTGSGVPLSVAVDGKGNIYVGADCYRSECPNPHGIQYGVIKLGPSGAMVNGLLGNNPYVAIGPGEQEFVTINAVAVDARDDLYLASSAIRSPKSDFYSGVIAYTGGTALRAIYALPGRSAPVGTAFDAHNALYVAYGNHVLRYVP